MAMDRQAFLASSGLRVETLELWLEQRWLVPAPGAASETFTETDVARVRLICELRDDFGSNDAGIDIILHLIDQLHDMRRAFGELRRELPGRPGG